MISTGTWMVVLLLWLGSNMDVAVRPLPPRLEFIDNLCDVTENPRRCESDSAGVVIRALYLLDSRTIYLPTGWSPNNVEDMSFLLHELVHHVQHERGMLPAKSLEARCDAEMQAFKLQAKWLAEQNYRDTDWVEIGKWFCRRIGVQR